MDPDTTSTEDGERAIDLEVLLKKGPICDEDIKNIIHDIAGDPEDEKELLKILGIDGGIDEVNGLDSVDGARPSVCNPVREYITYVGLLAAVRCSTSFRQTNVVFKHSLDKPDAIPSFTLEGGLSACEAYSRALKNGRARDKRVKVVLIGQDGAAKTKLSQLLRGKCCYNGGRRTSGIQIDVSENPWKLSSRSSSENEDKQAKKTGRDYPYESEETASDEVDAGMSRSPVQAENVAGHLNEEDSSDEMWPVFWELSGDGVDRALHPMYMTPDAIYVLAFDLSEDTLDNGANQGESRMENIMKHIDMVHSLRHAQSGDHEVSAPVFLVGVHSGRSKKEIERIFDRLSENSLISEHVGKPFTVDTTQATGKENDQINRLRQEIVIAARTMPHAEKEIPSHWLEIENMIEWKCRNGANFVYQSDFMKEINTVPESSDADEILKFLQNRDSIVCHDGLVVLNQQWLVGVIRQILNTVQDENECMNSRRHRINLKKKGVLSSEHVGNVCRRHGLCEIKEHLISIMEMFDLISPVEQNRSTFMVHHMLGPVSEEEIFQQGDNRVLLPVYLTFKTQHVPEGLFLRLLSRLREWVTTKTPCEQVGLYSNGARFILNDMNFLGLFCYKSVIKLQVWSQNKSKGVSSKCLEEICCCLKGNLGDIQKTCRWLRSVSWDFSIRCSLCPGIPDPTSGLGVRHDKEGCVHEDCAHYLPLGNRQYYCPHAKGQEHIIPEELYKEWRRALQTDENNNKIQKRTTPVIDHVQDKDKVQIVFLSMEWGSSKGGLPTVNRLLAIEFAKNSKVEVTLYAVDCNEGDVGEARDHGIRIIKAKERPGFDELERLCFPLHKDFHIDVVIGHGVKLGKQAQMLKELYPSLLWVQFGHTLPEELALYKGYEKNVYQGQVKHLSEKQLIQMADLAVAIGPKITEMYRTYLRPYPEKEVHQLVPTPSIFREFANLEQAEEERANFSVLVFGRGDEEDFQVKGYDIPPKAIAELNDPKYRLYFVGAPQGDMEKVTERLVQQGIDKSQLKVRSFITKREDLADLLCTVDLALMPSRTEGFGLTALEALTAGLPILVGTNSGFAEALRLLDDSAFASSFIVKSDDAKEWAQAIRDVKAKERSQRLNEAQKLKECYENTFDWSDQCETILGLILGKQNKVDKEIEGESVEDDVPDSAIAETSEELPRKENLNPLYSQETQLPRKREVAKKQEQETKKPERPKGEQGIKVYPRRPTAWLLPFVVVAVVFLVAVFIVFTKYQTQTTLFDPVH
ncbi:PREDICTED: uncharacterized protein LOC107338309 isoform X3 [Acropora digitifera]|uniref:uncharacterized protein LOC107338309 isoform X3 n=1 Tax=Acropora digitifera TaxID=70779 RepID=UPI00077B20F0|nr:PREDICTED: uncharacterized protein LOC107338309 isoform X3 [Acropora digitifera]XP_015759030.1 PREDICTED: uncharacterized protein LOC107338309 isoform X3 [Acropora digitifera]